MKKAFAICCLKPNRDYVRMTLACARSLRATGNKEDILVLTTDETLKDQIGDRYDVRFYEPIFYPALYHAENSLSIIDASKLNLWRLDDYDKVIGLDADIIARKNCDELWSRPELQYVGAAKSSPLQGSMFVLEPSRAKFDEMYDLACRSVFDPETGWNNVGRFPHWENRSETADWRWQSAMSTQGFLYYYFRFVRKRAFWSEMREWFDHFGGDRKWGEDYKRSCHELIKLM